MSGGQRLSPIVDTREAALLAQRLASAKTLALDTEGDGMFRYRARLCTVQLAADGEVFVLDTLAVDAALSLGELLGARGPEKVVHDVSFDARVLFAHGIVLDRVFDSAIAARFLGLKNTGLSSLLAESFGVALPKDKQQADWGARPLDDEALSYLANDVRHLEALATLLRGRVHERGIADEVHEECAYQLAEARAPAVESSPFARIKGAALRAPKERARLYELAAERESIARELDVPPTRLLPNELLMKFARSEQVTAPAVEAKLSSFRVWSSTSAAAYAGRLCAAHERAQALEDAPEEEVRSLVPRQLPAAEIERKKRRRRLLSEFRSREAQARDVDLQVVLPGHCLSDIVDLEALSLETLLSVPGFGRCRAERYGELLVAELTASW